MLLFTPSKKVPLAQSVEQWTHKCAIVVLKTLIGKPIHHVTFDVKHQLS